MSNDKQLTPLDTIVSLCKRRGFVYQSSEIYGGINGFWDYGPLGTELKNNLRDAWWKQMVITPPLGPDGTPVEIVGIDSSIITEEAKGETDLAKATRDGVREPLNRRSEVVITVQ